LFVFTYHMRVFLIYSADHLIVVQLTDDRLTVINTNTCVQWTVHTGDLTAQMTNTVNNQTCTLLLLLIIRLYILLILLII
jgi:hypothetical protein